MPKPKPNPRPTIKVKQLDDGTVEAFCPECSQTRNAKNVGASAVLIYGHLIGSHGYPLTNGYDDYQIKITT